MFLARNPGKTYDQRKILTHVKNILTFATQKLTNATHAPTNPRNAGTHVTHVTTQPTRFSRLHCITCEFLLTTNGSFQN